MSGERLDIAQRSTPVRVLLRFGFIDWMVVLSTVISRSATALALLVYRPIRHAAYSKLLKRATTGCAVALKAFL